MSQTGRDAPASSHYTGESGERYFEHTRKSKSDVAQSESAKVFLPYVGADLTVLDFGCGTGGIVSSLPAKRRLGVEINEPSVAASRARGIEVFASASEVPDAAADVVITHHALEHTLEPLTVLRELRRILKPGGTLVIVVPAEEPRRQANWRLHHDDPSQHLFSWNPRTLGNLIGVAGFEVVEGFVSHHTGFTRLTSRLRSVPLLMRLANWAVARGASRMSTVCVARRPVVD